MNNKTKFNISVLICLTIALSACGTEPPACDSKEVNEVLKDIVKDWDLILLKNEAISTIESKDRSRMCKSLMTVKEKGSDSEKLPVKYEIDLADNGEEFSVTLRRDF